MDLRDIVLSATFIAVALFLTFPAGVWIGFILTGEDLREFGSKNGGMTNLSRLLEAHGIKHISFWVGLDLALDMAKGGLPLALAFLFLPKYLPIAGLLGVIAVLGNHFPVIVPGKYFRGGKSVAVSGGVMTMFLVIALHGYHALWVPISLILILGVSAFLFKLFGRERRVYPSLLLVFFLLFFFTAIAMNSETFIVYPACLLIMAIAVLFFHHNNLGKEIKKANIPRNHRDLLHRTAAVAKTSVGWLMANLF